MFAMAGLWDHCVIEEEDHFSCTILTTSPNSLIEEVHHRMPVILNTEEKIRRWLDPDLTERVALEELFQPIDSGLVQSQPAED